MPGAPRSGGWLWPLDWAARLAAALPLEKALAFMHGLLGDARKLTHVAYLRRDPLLPEFLGIRRVASQSVLARCAKIQKAGANFLTLK